MKRIIAGLITAALAGCTQASGPVVDRGVFGCPSGYVAHPYNPKQCVIPAIAARVYARYAPEPEPVNPYREYQVQAPQQQPDATARAIEDQTYAIRVQQAEQVNADLAARRAADEANDN